MRVFYSTLIITSAILLTGCGGLVKGATQEVTLVTPGAWDAECTLDNGVKYKVASGETFTIMRSNNEIKVDCYAPGNRRKQMIVESGGNSWAVGDVLTGIVPGVAYDHLSGGLYRYPEVITVDFVGAPVIGHELPAYHNKDTPNPYTQAIEGYAAGTLLTPADSGYLKRGIQRRDMSSVNPFSTGDDAEMPDTVEISSSGTSIKKSAVPTGSDAESLTRSANPGVFDKEAK